MLELEELPAASLPADGLRLRLLSSKSALRPDVESEAAELTPTAWLWLPGACGWLMDDCGESAVLRRTTGVSAKTVSDERLRFGSFVSGCINDTLTRGGWRRAPTC